MLKRRGRQLLVGVLAGLLVLLATLPYWATLPLLRNWISRAVVPSTHVQVTVGGAMAGWYSPVEVRAIEIRGPDGEPALTIPRLCSDRCWWKFLFDRSNLGVFRVERPLVQARVTASGCDLLAVLDTLARSSAIPPQTALQLQIVAATLSVRTPELAEPWQAEDINLCLTRRGAKPGTGQLPQWVVQPGTVFDHAPITARVCHDMLRYIAPLLADATQVSGTFSLDLEEFRMAEGNLRAAEASGRLVIHSLDVQPGPMLSRLSGLLQLPSTIHAAKGQQIQFAVRGGRVHHRAEVFRIHELSVTTQGSVGFDESLDLVAEISLPAILPAGLPGIDLGKGKVLRVPIRGTLSRPEIQLDASTAPVQLLQDVLQGLQKTAPAAPGILQQLLDRSKP